MLLLTEPNVLLLDEPTNDLDIETLNVLEDFLDGWPGTLVVVSHDRYFLERVTDSVWALLGDGQISMLPGGVDDYLARRAASRESAAVTPATSSGAPATEAAKPRAGSAEERAARKTMTRLDRQLRRLTGQEATLNAAIVEHAQDYARLAELSAELQVVSAERDQVETEWLAAAEVLE
jgi:ABC transport system ATP-binding/permease protein